MRSIFEVAISERTGSDLTATINGHSARLSTDFNASAGGTISYIFPATRSLVAEGDGWYLDSAGCLNLTGAVTIGQEYNATIPWSSYKSQITSVLAKPGASITNCRNLFQECSNLKNSGSAGTQYIRG